MLFFVIKYFVPVDWGTRVEVCCLSLRTVYRQKKNQPLCLFIERGAALGAPILFFWCRVSPIDYHICRGRIDPKMFGIGIPYVADEWLIDLTRRASSID